MTFDADEKKELAGASHGVGNEDKNIKDGVVGEAQIDDKLRINSIDENVKDGSEQVAQVHGALQVQEQQARGAVVCWEQFLHLRSIKVLLVENDDSTRHIVTALLRNCNYEVIEVANGSQAWKILEDLTIHIDLILTEVVMPCLSGIGLLCKIMSHKTRKNVPVIMMSSHDSMGLVLKCLSKGAVDFLVKPIRKNELKNLWQHVWRRCQSSSGSGSESGTQTQKSVKSETNEKSENNSGSKDGENNGSTGLNVGDGSDDGSGTQSSWTKQAVEVDSSQAVTLRNHVAECPDSTCAQVVRSNYETSGNKGVPVTATRELQQEEQLDNFAKAKDLMMAKPRNIELPLKNADEVPFNLGKNEGNLPEKDSNPSSKRIDNGQANPTIECIPNKHKAVITSISGPQLHSRESEAPREFVKAPEIRKVNDVSKQRVIELSLKRLRGVNNAEKTFQDDRNILRRSELSAFSRYNTSSIAFRAPNGIIGSSSSLNNSPGVVRKESVYDVLSHSNGLSSNDDIDKGSSTSKFAPNPIIMKDKSEATPLINGLHPSSAFMPVKNNLRCASHQAIATKDDNIATSAHLAPTGGLQQGLSIQQSHQHHHHFHYVDRQPPSSNYDYSSLNKLAADAPQCGSSNMLGGLVEGNPLHCTLNRSASGSNHESNGQNGSSTAVNAVGAIAESDIGLAGKSGSGDASGSGNGNRIDENKFAQREAALTKFRQKRKELCFRKKVRYQNRKRLAEQRPRVRGQFVRQTGHENSS